MATPRPVTRLVTPQPVLEGAGVKLKRSIATRELDAVDPFLLFDDFSSTDPADHIRGFPWHPHRGIETVTYVLSGEVRHRDSLGNEGTIGADQVQWMTAGSGIMHEEMPQETPGGLVGFQLWVNLPAKEKMSTPRYRDIRAEEMAQLSPVEGVALRVIAGSFGDTQGAVTEMAADPTYFDLDLAPEASVVLPLSAEKNACAYLFRGTAVFGPGANASDGTEASGGATGHGGGEGSGGETGHGGGEGSDGETGPDSGDPAPAAHGGLRGDSIAPIGSPHLVVFGEGDQVWIRAGAEGARLLLMAGKPLNEPIARYGPFVMNTREEIEEALHDLRNDNFIREKPAGIE